MVSARFGISPWTRVDEANSVSDGRSGWTGKMEALVARAFLVVVDLSSQYTRAEGAMAFSVKTPSSVCIVVEEGIPLPSELQYQKVIRRPDLASLEVGDFVEELRNWLTQSTTELQHTLESEMHRLLEVKEYRAAVISAITNLESMLRERLEVSERTAGRGTSVRQILRRAGEHGLLGRFSRFNVERVDEWLRIRNAVVHSSGSVSWQRAHAIVKGVVEIRQLLG